MTRTETKDPNQIYGFYSSVQAREVEWLWYPYIPFGKLTLIEGDPGDGKSTFMLHIAALLTQGKTMPDGFSPSSTFSVIYQCAEDDIADTVKPRLIAAGADCNKVAYILDADDPLTLEDDRIELAIENSGARLLILDPLQSFLPQDGDMQSAGRMRSLLGKLTVTAAKTNCAIVLIGHMNKRNGTKSLYRGLGSIDISAIARSVLMVARDADNPLIRYMFPIKTSLAPEGPAIGFRFDRAKGFHWIGVCDANLKDDVSLTVPPPGKRAEATDIVVSMIREGPAESAEILERLSLHGISERTAYKVKRELDICSYKSGNVWYWKFKDEDGD